MNNKFSKIFFFATITILLNTKNLNCDNCNKNCNNFYPSSIFVPRQLSYNPILENALLLDSKNTNNYKGNQKYAFSVKPIYSQSVGSKFQNNFNICNKCCLNIQEDNTGDINPLWFSVISTDTTYYSSKLSFCPKRQTYGSMIYFSVKPTKHFEISLNTAILGSKNNMCIHENCIDYLGTCTNKTVTQSFANCDRHFGRICGAQKKAGLDDIQLKFIFNSCRDQNCCDKSISDKEANPNQDITEFSDLKKHECKKHENIFWSAYGLLGIPTGSGSKATYLFEPLIGSKHAQLGFGANMQWDIKNYKCGKWSLLSELKYRYAFSGQECRSFDLTKNCQWSRYMLFVNESDKYTTYPAINNLTFKADVIPGSSLDFYLATHINHNAWNFEFGYDFWYRACEKIKLCCANMPNVGIADLLGISLQNPQSASTANISQGAKTGTNQMTSDTTFIPVTLCDINLCSGAQQKALSNSFYGSIGYEFKTKCDNSILLGINCDYEHGSCSTPDNITTWINLDFSF